jgi:hypothetical protein
LHALVRWRSRSSRDACGFQSTPCRGFFPVIRHDSARRIAAIVSAYWVRLNKRTETAIDRYDSEIGRFLCLFSLKKGFDGETIFLAEKVGFSGFY